MRAAIVEPRRRAPERHAGGYLAGGSWLANRAAQARLQARLGFGSVLMSNHTTLDLRGTLDRIDGPALLPIRGR